MVQFEDLNPKTRKISFECKLLRINNAFAFPSLRRVGHAKYAHLMRYLSIYCTAIKRLEKFRLVSNYV